MAKNYTTVPDKAVRDQFSEAMWDTHLRDNINNLMSPAMCRLRHSVSQTITTGTETDKNFDTEDLDTDGMHDTVTNNSRITPTTAGLYVVTACSVWDTGTTGYRAGYIKKNDTDYLAANTVPASAGATETVVTTVESMNGSTDYVENRVAHSQGANQNVAASGSSTERRTSLAAVWVGRTS